MSSPVIKDGEREKKKKRILKSDSSPSVTETKKAKSADSVPSRVTTDIEPHSDTRNINILNIQYQYGICAYTHSQDSL